MGRIASQHRVSRLAPGLRKAIRRHPHPFELALALGTQGERSDAPLLCRLLDRWPERVELALALVRLGDPELAELARDRWVPPTDLERKLEDPLWEARVRELDSHRLLRRLRRHRTRALASNTKPHAWVVAQARLTPDHLEFEGLDGKLRGSAKRLQGVARLERRLCFGGGRGLGSGAHRRPPSGWGTADA